MTKTLIYQCATGDHYIAFDVPDNILNRDFRKFKSEGIDGVDLEVHWYPLEGDIEGSYNQTVLDNLRRTISVAIANNLKVTIRLITAWSEHRDWHEIPTYVIDPTTGQNMMLAIIRDNAMRAAWINFTEWLLNGIKDLPIYRWCLMTEPRYWSSPGISVDHKENFISLWEEMRILIKRQLPDVRVSVDFACHDLVTTTQQNSYEVYFGWESRIFQAIDDWCVHFHPYEWASSQPNHPEYITIYTNILLDSLKKAKASVNTSGRVGITTGAGSGFGTDDQAQLEQWKYCAEVLSHTAFDFVQGFYWGGMFNLGFGMNLCKDSLGESRPAYTVFETMRVGGQPWAILLPALAVTILFAWILTH